MKYYTKSAYTANSSNMDVCRTCVAQKCIMKHACKHKYKQMMLPAFCQHVVSVHLTAK